MRLALLALLALALALPAACGGGGTQKPKGKVVVTDTVVEIVEPLRFTTELELTPSSYQTLDRIAKTLIDNPAIQLVEIQAYVLEGPDDARQDLADRRARMLVDHLVGKGVEAARLTPGGYIKLPEGRTQAHVEFLILKRAPGE